MCVLANWNPGLLRAGKQKEVTQLNSHNPIGNSMQAEEKLTGPGLIPSMGGLM
jgi:hypothetical protein